MRKAFFHIVSFLLLLTPYIAGAKALENPLGYDDLGVFFERLLDLVVLIGFPVIVLFMVFIGFKFIQAEGNAEQLKKLRGQFFWALIGALLVLGAQALLIAIRGTVADLKQGI
jgi:amino acid transporter